MSDYENPWTCAILEDIPMGIAPQHVHQLHHSILLEYGEQMSLYEDMIKIYGELPYLMVRFGRLQMIGGASTLAVRTLRKVLKALSDIGVGDDQLQQFILDCHLSAEQESVQMSQIASLTMFDQVWKMTRTHSFPQIPFTPSTADMIKSRWQELTPQGSTFFEKYLRSLCVETNHIEGTFLLAQQCTQDLMHCGIAEATISYLPQSKIKDPKMIKNILNDTLAAYHKMRPFVQDPEGLSLEVLCEIHLSLMKTCQYSKEGAYIPGGKTRQETRKTVIVRGGTSGDIQCCPFEQVDAEIKYICQMAKQLIQNWKNPFAVASWLHLVLVRCHPFEVTMVYHAETG
ncbi:hypothetical protein H2248_007970 [Termitomyces sp. 'cryptogamus']|nr:hypothetical protein H2248_007970 [Termitomyces sp. 'cryptogamus']